MTVTSRTLIFVLKIRLVNQVYLLLVFDTFHIKGFFSVPCSFKNYRNLFFRHLLRNLNQFKNLIYHFEQVI